MANINIRNVREETKHSIPETVTGFLSKYRLLFLMIIGGLIAAALAIGLVSYFVTQSHAKGLAAIEEIAYRLEKTPKEELETAVAEALASLDNYTTGKSVVSTRANLLKAELYFRDKKYEDARSAWITAAETQKTVYTAPVAWYNAAVCSEELGDTASAISQYEAAIAFEDFALKTHAIFSLARIKDESADYAGAAVHYQELGDTYTDDSWAKLAKSRLIALRAEGKIQ
jgi:tetratricopeptide (TPR) repeat protein